MPRLYVHLAPPLVSPDRLRNAAVAVIDLVRATTTVCHALAAGARCVVPVCTLEEALALRGREPFADALLGGERGAVRPEGFHLGNSPREYTPQAVQHRTIIFTTSNGTRAMLHGAEARQVVLASFVNFHRVAECLLGWLREFRSAHILCAGRLQQPTAEDTLLAGALVAEVLQGWESSPASSALDLGSSAAEALALWQEVAGELQLVPACWSPEATARLAGWLQQHTPGGRHVAEVGQGEDLLLCAHVDCVPVLPHLVPGEPWTVQLPDIEGLPRSASSG